MNKKQISTAMSIGISVATGGAYADCGSDPAPREKYKGNYFCDFCTPINDGVAGYAAMFMKGEVNLGQGQWRPGDTITLTNGSEWRTYQYNYMYGNWTPITGGQGIGPGEPRNHNGAGTLCEDIEENEDQDSSYNGGSTNYSGNSSYSVNDSLDDYWHEHDMGSIPSGGNVYIEDITEEANASYWQNYYSRLYSSQSVCTYC